MEKAKKDVGQKFRRIKHNLVNSSKKEEDDDLRIIHALETRNSKIISIIQAYKKNVAATIKTGLKEENVDKRRKKLDEFNLAADLREGAGELEMYHTTCLHKVMNKLGTVLQFSLEEKVKQDMMVEKRVLDDLMQYLEIDRNLAKNKEKLNNAFTDLDIAKRALDKSDNPTPHLQEDVDTKYQRLESQKDSYITEIYSMIAKEQEIAKVFASFLEEKLEYHRVAMRAIEMALPEIRRDIDNARPRPVFGVDLTEHLRHSGTRIAVVLETTCEMLRHGNGMTEKGVFRVSGNNTKIRRMKAAFDAGQINNDTKAYHLDPHSVCSVLKCYLRELPDPLLTHRLYNEWMAAAKLEGEDRLKAIENCIVQLPASHRDNLTYLINFLSELLQYQDQTSMNAGNLAIVFGPNLLGGDIEGNNAIGTRIVETLLKNAQRLFGVAIRNEDSPPLRIIDKTKEQLMLEIDETSKLNRNNSARSFASPRSRPKEKAPPPPIVTPRTSDPPLIDLNDDWTTINRAEAARFYGPHGSHNLHPYQGENERGPSQMTDSYDSLDSFDDFGDESLSRSNTERRPNRPPPPALRQISEIANPRPTSYNMAIHYEQNPQPMPRNQALVVENPLAKAPSIRKPTILPDTTVGVSDDNNRTVVAVEAPPSRVKPPLPAKPKPEDNKESSRL